MTSIDGGGEARERRRRRRLNFLIIYSDIHEDLENDTDWIVSFQSLVTCIIYDFVIRLPFASDGGLPVRLSGESGFARCLAAM